jgi:hypothetical protein
MQEILIKEHVLLEGATTAAKALTTQLCLEITLLQRRVAGDGAKIVKGSFMQEILIKEHVLPEGATTAAKALNMGLTGSILS